MHLSVVIPVMNEQDNIKPLINQIDTALKDIDYELILVDDGSTDKTIENVETFALNNTKLLVFNRNYGQTMAMVAGIDEAQGELIVTLDGDLQNDPSDIPIMIEILENGDYDIVAGVRNNRKDGMFLRKIPSKIANWFIGKFTGVYLSDYGCTLKVFKNNVAKNLGLYGELHRFIPVLAKLYGAKMTEISVKHHARIHGSSKYGISRTLKVFSDLLLMVFFQKYNTKPMHLFGTLGVVTFGIGMVINFYLFVLKLFGENIGTKPLLIMGAGLSLIGIQLITTGFIAEILMRTYYESQNKKPYIIKKKIVKKS